MTEYAFVLAGVAVLAAAAYLTFGQSIVAMLGPVVSAFTSEKHTTLSEVRRCSQSHTRS